MTQRVTVATGAVAVTETVTCQVVVAVDVDVVAVVVIMIALQLSASIATHTIPSSRTRLSSSLIHCECQWTRYSKSRDFTAGATAVVVAFMLQTVPVATS